MAGVYGIERKTGGGASESNQPFDAPHRNNGFEDRGSDQSPFASLCTRNPDTDRRGQTSSVVSTNPEGLRDFGERRHRTSATIRITANRSEAHVIGFIRRTSHIDLMIQTRRTRDPTGQNTHVPSRSHFQ